jgi:hypothetical protein
MWRIWASTLRGHAVLPAYSLVMLEFVLALTFVTLLVLFLRALHLSRS